jgi:hypothetical protein
VLDSTKFSSIIYILYEGGSLSPPVVTPGSETKSPVTAEQPSSKEEQMAKKSAKGGKKKGGKKR